MVSMFGVKLTLAQFIQPILIYFVLQTRSKAAVWTTSLITLMALRPNFGLPLGPIVVQYLLSVGNHEILIAFYTFWSWTNLRCISYSLDMIDGESSGNLFDLTSYVFYPPILLSGPVIIYRIYHKGVRGWATKAPSFKHLTFQLNSEYRSWTFRRCFEFVARLAKYFGYYMVCSWSRQVLYHGGLKRNADLLSVLDFWSLLGVGSMSVSSFYLLYVFTYGVPLLFAKEDGIRGIEHPRCVWSIHLYSDMWRLFDTGLYQFLKL